LLLTRERQKSFIVRPMQRKISLRPANARRHPPHMQAAPAAAKSLVDPLVVATAAHRGSSRREPLFHLEIDGIYRESPMEAAIERVMTTYGMMVNLTLAQEQTVREKVSKFLEERSETDEQKLAIEGLRYVRGIPVDAW
jgi:hypothetical protein